MSSSFKVREVYEASDFNLRAGVTKKHLCAVQIYLTSVTLLTGLQAQVVSVDRDLIETDFIHMKPLKAREAR